MNWSFIFFFNSALLGIGLAMDAFSISLANGLKNSKMGLNKMLSISIVFAIFQAIMPLIGWVCVHTIVEHFKIFEKYIPFIALALLLFIGIKMLIESKRNQDNSEQSKNLTITTLLIQGIATSIDALSVGFTIAEYEFPMAMICVSIIAIITFFICLFGVFIGKKFGNQFSHKAEVFGGVILIIIGIEIFITGII